MTWILLPGMDGTGDLFAPFIAALPKSDLPVIVRYPRNQVLETKEYIRLIDDSLPITGEYVIIAESFSGAFGIHIAARNPTPKRLRALILSATFAQPPIRGLPNLILRLFAPVLLRLQPPRFLLKRLLFEATTPQNEIDHLRAVLGGVHPNVLSHRFRLSHTRDLTNLLPAIKIPTLILGAKNDRLIPRSITEQLSSIPTSWTLWIESPHLLLQTHPREALQAIHEFLS